MPRDPNTKPAMSYCLSPICQKPENPPQTKICLTCGSELLLKDRYRACRFLDSGGMSRAYLAVDEDTPSRHTCVIKQFFPAPHVATNPKSFGKSLELFQREATQLDKLGRESPNIPKLLAFLEQDKTFYLVQEYVDGQNLLKELSVNGPYTETHIRQFLQKILPVLEFIHGHNVAHRDIKPENVMHRQNGQLVLIDFGLSKQLTDNVSSRGTTGGTMGYAPPEQIRGGMAYPATDLFALGATCIHLLTGITPDNLYDFQQNRWIWRDLLAKNQRYVSDNLAEIFDKMLESRVENRYQSAQAVISDLANPLTRSMQALRRKRILLLAGTTVPLVAALVAGVVFMDPIKCRMGIETAYCPVVITPDTSPRTINGVRYFPFAPAADSQGKSAEFNMAILTEEYRWHPGSSTDVSADGQNPRPLRSLKVSLENKGITKIMDNPNQVIAVGTSSCEGTTQEEESRALERAKTIQNDLGRAIFAVNEYPILSLGQYKKDSCSRSGKDNAFQRTVILMGIRRESTGVVLNEALYNRLKNISKEFRLEDYSLGSKDKLKLWMSEAAVAATTDTVKTPPQ
jgi:eukaryotic-like serine/threonine-protein kinase